MIKMTLSQPEIKMKIEPAKVVYQGGEAYEGNYEITPSEELQTLPTANRMLARNIVVAPIPQNYGRITYSGGGITIT